MSSPPLKRSKQQHISSSRAWQRPSQSPLALLLNLPRELRDSIYEHYGLDWNDINSAMRRFEEKVEAVLFVHKPKHQSEYQETRDRARYSLARGCIRIAPRSTPSLLLLCRQVTDEALEMLRKKPLTIGPPISLVPGDLWPLQVTAFISGPTLQFIRHLVLDPDSRSQSWCDKSALGYCSYTLVRSTGCSSVYYHDQDALEQIEMQDLASWLWGLRNALECSQALRSLTVQFRKPHPFTHRRLYYQVLFTDLVKHLPLIDVSPPEDNDTAELLMCDLLTDGRSESGDREDED